MKLDKIVSIVIWGTGIAILLWVIILKGYTIVSYNWPKEFREMATVKMALDFSRGINPYSVQLLQSENPIINNMYGFMAPLIMSPFIKVFMHISNMSALQICELVTLGVEIIGLFSCYGIVYLKCHKHSLAVWASLLIYACYWRYSPVGGAFPDQFGLTISLILLLYITMSERDKSCNPIICALFVILQFYVKQYFVFVAVGLWVYLWINYSFKHAIHFAFAGTILGLLSMGIVNLIFPLYFTETIPLAQGQTTTGNFVYSYMQAIRLMGKSFVVCTLFLMLGVGIVIHGIIKFREMNIPGVIVKQQKRKLQISYEALQIFIMLPFTFYIAQNTGTIYTYYLQTWVPYVILCSFVILCYGIQFWDKRIKCKYRLYAMLGILFLVSCVGIIKWIRQPLMNEEQAANWQKAYQILDEFSSEGEILISPHLSNYCLENDLFTSEYGQAEFNTVSNYENWNKSWLWRRLFPNAGTVLQKNIENNEQIYNKVINGDYSCIALTRAGNYNIPYDDIEVWSEGKYILLTSLTLEMGNQEWKTYFYCRNHL